MSNYSTDAGNNTIKKRYEQVLSVTDKTSTYISNSDWGSYSLSTQESIVDTMTWDTATAYLLLPPYVHYNSDYGLKLSSSKQASHYSVELEEIVQDYNGTGCDMLVLNLERSNEVTIQSALLKSN